jgi:hypothetical protein
MNETAATNSVDVNPELLFAASRSKVRNMLPSIDALTDEQCRRIIGRYAAGVSGNFVTWLAAGNVCCRALEARYATAENAYIEIRDDHPGMLRDFARMSAAEPTISEYRSAEKEASRIQASVSEMSGLFIVTLVGTLENVSLDYIPWLGLISRQLGNRDMRYVDIHGEADIAHADQFRWAVGREAKLYEDPQRILQNGADAAVDFITALLRPEA